ncbi:hypothetical protein T440DRAFT_503349 [Plenodomus tracheiphilus IPT5]|uniref:Uncharacterized protein n=1 Tax=Plenodomus tracheiphilus IPT5 TaxID=1408161 RepID=A0A6A7BQL6_9PLEO|nr:hypothetical protein T440DRAFT_503349 [Plenodomus tracheiphilus IPT5]
MRGGANPGFSATATTWYGQDLTNKPTQPKRRAAPVVEHHGFFASGYAARNTLARVAVPHLPPSRLVVVLHCTAPQQEPARQCTLSPSHTRTLAHSHMTAAQPVPRTGNAIFSSLAATGHHLALELLERQRQSRAITVASPRSNHSPGALPVSPAWMQLTRRCSSAFDRWPICPSPARWKHVALLAAKTSKEYRGRHSAPKIAPPAASRRRRCLDQHAWGPRAVPMCRPPEIHPQYCTCIMTIQHTLSSMILHDSP